MEIAYIVKCRFYDGSEFYKTDPIENNLFFKTKDEAWTFIKEYENNTKYTVLCEIKEVYLIEKKW